MQVLARFCFIALFALVACSDDDDSGANNNALNCATGTVAKDGKCVPDDSSTGGSAGANSGGSAGTGGSNVGGSAGSAGSSGGNGGGGNSAGGSSTGGSGGSAVDLGKQPPEPGANNPGDGPGAVFAMDKVLLGDTRPDGTPDLQNGWTSYGINVDKKISTATSNDLCKPADNASATAVYPDGDDGIDNAYGHHIIPVLSGFASDFSILTNDSIAQGNTTVIVKIDGLGSQSDYNPLTGCVYVGAPLADIPKFDGTDIWPVTSESLSAAPDQSSCKAKFTASYVSGNVWVSGPLEGVLELPFGGFGGGLKIHNAVIFMELSADRQTAANGVISGVLDTEETVSDTAAALGGFDPSLCPPSPAADSVLTQFRQASDIMNDGSQDPTKTCNGISIGLGFHMSKITLGGTADPVPPPQDPCSVN